jgi:hypothetical protein
MRRIFAIFVMLLAGCRTPPSRPPEKEMPLVSPPSQVVPQKVRQMIIFIPQTDDSAGAWFKWFVRYPKLRMVIAVSPRFQRLVQDANLKTQVLLLQKEGRLEFALQVPNAPILPLIVDTNSAKATLPPGAELPNPAYSYPDDVVQVIAQTKAGFFRRWNFTPRGLVLPYGAATPRLLSILDRLGFDWVAAALGLAAVEGPHHVGSLRVWDGAALSSGPTPTMIRVWDERQMKETGKGMKAVEVWADEIEKKGREPILPSDGSVTPVSPPPSAVWGGRTWADPDWSLWIGHPLKNTAWGLLRKTREALETYKNSGQASLSRLDMAFEEVAAAESSTYLAAIGNETISPAVVEDRTHEFQATLTGVYRLIGQTPPEEFSKPLLESSLEGVKRSSTTVRAEILPDGREHVILEDARGDGRGDGSLMEPPGFSPGALDLKSLEVWASSEAVTWSVTLGSSRGAWVDIYVDINGQPNAGTTALLRNRGLVASPTDAWEYALVLSGEKAAFYRTQAGGSYALESTFPLRVTEDTMQVTIPRPLMRGSPRRWGYQVLVRAQEGGPVYDLLDPPSVDQASLLSAVRGGKRCDVPFIRVRQIGR